MIRTVFELKIAFFLTAVTSSFPLFGLTVSTALLFFFLFQIEFDTIFALNANLAPPSHQNINESTLEAHQLSRVSICIKY